MSFSLVPLNNVYISCCSCFLYSDAIVVVVIKTQHAHTRKQAATNKQTNKCEAKAVCHIIKY